MNPPETEQENTYRQHRVVLSGSIYTILFLVVTTYGLDRAFVVYLDRVSQISRWNFLVQYSDSGMAVIILAELGIVVLLSPRSFANDPSGYGIDVCRSQIERTSLGDFGRVPRIRDEPANTPEARPS